MFSVVLYSHGKPLGGTWTDSATHPVLVAITKNASRCRGGTVSRWCYLLLMVATRRPEGMWK